MNKLLDKMFGPLVKWLAVRIPRAQRWLSVNLPEVLAVGGASGITVGAGHLAAFAAWMVSGAFCIAGAVLVARGRSLAAERAELAKRERDR